MTTAIIPNLNGNDKIFKISASSEYNEYWQAWKCANIEIGNIWATKGQTVNYWLEYEHPFEVSVQSFSMVGYQSEGSPLNWRLEAFNENDEWNVLYSAVDAPQNDIFRKYTIRSELVRPYSKFRLFVVSSTPNSTNPGLAHFQLYI